MANGNLLTTLKLIRNAKQMTRKELAGHLALGTSITSKLVTELFERGLIIEVGRSESGSGRPSDLLALNPETGYAIGIEIKATRQTAVLVNLIGEVLGSIVQEREVPPQPDKAWHWMKQLINLVIAQTTIMTEQILGVGACFGLRAIVDPETGSILSWTETPELAAVWKEVPMREELHKVLPFPHIIVDDLMRTQGIAEAQYGRMQGSDEDFIYAFADKGIGLALMLNGTAYVGPLHIAGEIGHTPIRNVNIRCNCGNVGCLETVASSFAILDRIKSSLDTSTIYSVLREDLEGLTITGVIEAAEIGDKLAYQTLIEAGEYFGYGLAAAVNLLGPKMVVVGGSLSKSNAYIDAARRSIRLQVLSPASAVVCVEPSNMGELAGAQGAATQVLNEVFEPNDPNILDLREMLSGIRKRHVNSVEE